jgi:superfamily I DNA/RNA helicase/Zn-dependent peptidase ImmA (M78 family)
MDGFEVIRRQAERLHNSVVAVGADSLNPSHLVDVAISHLDLELIVLPAGDPALKGARALFDEQSGLIFCEESGGANAQAILIAHEIGHVVIHAASSTCAAEDINVTRTTEAAPIGLQKVEDYGAKERRELQADVFAREFLFPRSKARSTFMDDGMGASKIATKTGLPIALVRQQIFDAMLMPEVPEAEPEVEAPKPNKPDPSQIEAAEHRGAPFQLQAGPGTGKTRTLVNRVKSLLAEGVDPSAILVLTFSNRAAGELAERLAIAEPEAAPKIWIGTFHAFGLDLVRRYHDRLSLSNDPPLFDRSDAIEVLEEILPTLPLVHYRNLWDPTLILRDIISGISRAKDELVTPTEYRQLADKMLAKAGDVDSRTAAEKCLEIAQVYDLYEAEMRKRGGVDFGDLIMLPTRLLEKDPAVRTSVQLRHRHVLVDEYQDVNRASAHLLKMIAGDGKRLWVVGDSRQSIYRFRGASSANMRLFGEDYPGAVAKPLGVNYRSTEQIIKTFEAFAPRMNASEGMIPLALLADRGSGSSMPELRRFLTQDDEIEGIAASIKELEASEVALRDQAVLCRTNKRLNEIAAGLEARGIPVLHLGSIFERDEIRDLLALLSLAVDPFGDGLARVAAMPRYQASLQDTYEALKNLRSGDGASLTRLHTLGSLESLTSEGKEAFGRLATDLASISVKASPWDYLSTYLLDRTELLRDLGTITTIAGQIRAVAIWQFLNFVREQGPAIAKLPIQRVLDRVRQLVLLAEERDLRQVPAAALHLNAVRLMTVHGSKGLEFEAVHLPGLTTSGFPASRRPQRCPPPTGMIEDAAGGSVSDAHQTEEECLFFVALSRAKAHLRLYLYQRQQNGNNRNPSSFLGHLGGRLREGAASQIALPPGSVRPTPLDIQTPSEWAMTGKLLVSYDKCPRRFFYTYILGLRGALKHTAFTRTHDCLHTVMRWLRDVRHHTPPTPGEVEKAFEGIWNERGPTGHAFEADYRRLASKILGTLIKTGAGETFREASSLPVDLSNGRILVEPDQVSVAADGTMLLRRVRTGYRRSTEYDDDLEYALYLLAAKSQSGRISVRALHLTDDIEEAVALTDQKLSTRRDKSNKLLRAFVDGWFEPETDAVGCPRCPHFFICAATPKGSLTLS